MAFWRNGKGSCGKRSKWSLGEVGKLGEMAFGRNEKCAKMKLGKTAKGQDRYWAKWEKVEVRKGEKRMCETEKKSGKMGMGEMELGKLEIN